MNPTPVMPSPPPPRPHGRAMTWWWVRMCSWLVLAFGLLALTWLVWNQTRQEQPRNASVTEVATTQDNIVSQAELIREFTPDLGFSTDIVPPLDPNRKDALTSRHTAEFRDNKFLTRQRNSWTLQIMNVTRESVIIDYLSKRNDRGQFHYFQYIDNAKQTHYILTYGIYNTLAQAMDGLTRSRFDLPGSVRAFPERFESYLPFAQRSTSNDGKLEDTERPRRVVLKPVKVPRDDPAQLPFERQPAKAERERDRQDDAASERRRERDEERRNPERERDRERSTDTARSSADGDWSERRREPKSEPPPSSTERERVREDLGDPIASGGAGRDRDTATEETPLPVIREPEESLP